jgi:sugar-phosphatase
MIELRISRASSLTCEALLFDMDGTLVNSMACVEGAWRAWAARHGLDARALLEDSHGRQNQETILRVAPHLNTPDELAHLARLEEDCRDVVAVPGARELLSALAVDGLVGADGLVSADPFGRAAEHWAVVTSAWRSLAEIRLGCAGLPLPRVLVTAEEVSRGKPDPAGYLLAAERLGVSPAACIVVEDAPVGVEAGRAAGMRVIGIATTYPHERLERAGCEICVEDLRSIALAGLASGRRARR